MWNFANFVCQCHQCGVLHSGNRNFFSSFVIDSKKRKGEERWRGPNHLVSFFSTVVDFCFAIPMWHGLLLKRRMLMYCRGATWNVSHAVLLL